MKKIFKIICLIIIILFLSLYFSKYTNSYYENQKVLTDDAIKRFEKDIKDGKKIVASNYIENEKNYNNKISELGIKTSNIIESFFNNSLSYMMKYLENIQNN